MYLAEVPLDKIKEQCRHTSIDQTLTYLRDLDVFRDSSAYDAVKGF